MIERNIIRTTYPKNRKSVSFQQNLYFLNFCVCVREREREMSDDRHMEQLFALFDKNKDCTIDVEDLKEVR